MPSVACYCLQRRGDEDVRQWCALGHVAAAPALTLAGPGRTGRRGVLYAPRAYILMATLGEWVEQMQKSPEERVMTAIMHALCGVVFGLAYNHLTQGSRR